MLTVLRAMPFRRWLSQVCTIYPITIRFTLCSLLSSINCSKMSLIFYHLYFISRTGFQNIIPDCNDSAGSSSYSEWLQRLLLMGANQMYSPICSATPPSIPLKAESTKFPVVFQLCTRVVKRLGLISNLSRIKNVAHFRAFIFFPTRPFGRQRVSDTFRAHFWPSHFLRYRSPSGLRL